MVKNAEFISKEMIKPSSPTLLHLRNYNLSFLDQIAPSAYVRVILFYETNHFTISDQFEASLLLKKSLSKTLTHLYPLAGRVIDDFVIQCNDEGAEYSEVRILCNLSETIESKDAKELNILFPYDMHFDIKKEVLLAVQFNMFDCGGIAIGLSFSHKLVDGTSANAFLLAWSHITRGIINNDEAVIEKINLDNAIHFPPTDVSGYVPNKAIVKDKIVTKRFLFKNSTIASLREATIKQTTRYEALTGFIWRRLMIIFQSKQDNKNKKYAAVHAVNFRGRMVPALANNSFGNIWQYAVAPSPLRVVETEKENQEWQHGILVSELRKTIRGIDGDYVKKMQNGDWYMNYMKEKMKNLEVIAFTSWCTFPMYEIDFGWGKPVFATSLGRPFKNVTVLTSTRNGDGIEAWINLLEEDMLAFETDSELLSFVN